jgi:FMN phosphatase YigB (HAD superfamily)
MRIFLDFDDVIFNTKSFFEKLKVVYVPFGISSELFEATYQELKKERAVSWLGYSSGLHIGKLQEHMTVDVQELQNAITFFLTDTSEFVFPDVKDFLEWTSKQGYSVSILSYGDEEFQTQKVNGTQLGTYFDKVIVTDKEKSQALLAEGVSADETIWFFDDRYQFLENVKEKLPSVQAILVTRPEGRYQDECGVACNSQIRNLKDGRDIIENAR